VRSSNHPTFLEESTFDLETFLFRSELPISNGFHANHIDHEAPNRPTWITQQAGASASPSNTILISPISPTMKLKKYQFLIPATLLSGANLLGIQTL